MFGILAKESRDRLDNGLLTDYTDDERQTSWSPKRVVRMGKAGVSGMDAGVREPRGGPDGERQTPGIVVSECRRDHH